VNAPNQSSILLDYGSRPGTPKHGVMINTDVGPRPGGALAISVLGSEGEIHTIVPGDRQYVDGTAEIIKMIKHMMKTRKTPPIMDQVVETIAIIEAFRKARDTGKPARVADFLKKS